MSAGYHITHNEAVCSTPELPVAPCLNQMQSVHRYYSAYSAESEGSVGSAGSSVLLPHGSVPPLFGQLHSVSIGTHADSGT